MRTRFYFVRYDPPAPREPWRAGSHYIVYFNTKVSHGLACLCSDCYECVTKKCTKYTDGERRVVVDEKGLRALKADSRIKITRILKKCCIHT